MIITPVRRAVGTGVAIVVLVVIIYLIMQGFDRGENMATYRRDSLSTGSQFAKETSFTLMPMITQQPSRPPVLFLTYRSRAEVPDYVWQRFAKYTKGYTIEFFDDTRCRLSLYPFGPTVMKKFDSLRGAHKADLWRYCMMYQHGGVYSDIKTVMTRQLSEIVPREDHNYTVLGMSRYGDQIYNGFLALVPRNPVMMESIHHVVKTPVKEAKREYLVFCFALHSLLSAYLGQLRAGTVRDWTFFKETLTTTTCAAGERDKYGHCKIVWKNEQGDVMAVARDRNYPWSK